MKIYLSLFVVILMMAFIGCQPNLVVQDAQIDFAEKTVQVFVKNIGDKDAGEHLTYIEINDVSASNSLKPQTQFSAKVSGIAVGNSWNSGPIPFSDFSSHRGLDLYSLTLANLVVRADAKNMVTESNENDNVLDENRP